MNYEIGDTVVHWTHGLGTVVAIDKMITDGITQQYYVVKIALLKIWVPVTGVNAESIRLPTERVQFEVLFDVLRAPGNQLPDNQYKRKNELRKRMQKRTLGDLCQLIRDLTDRKQQHTLNQYDAAVLFQAEEHLLDEWVLALDVKRAVALGELKKLLERTLPEQVI